MSKKIMKIIDLNSGLMECQVCGAIHHGQIKPDSNGSFYRSCWKCRNGCTIEDLQKQRNKLNRQISSLKKAQNKIN